MLLPAGRCEQGDGQDGDGYGGFGECSNVGREGVHVVLRFERNIAAATSPDKSSGWKKAGTDGRDEIDVDTPAHSAIVLLKSP